MTKTVDIWTDGACSGNPGPGGWGVLLKAGDHRRELWGGEADTTNNRMELTAAIEGLKALKRRSDVILHTDSTYVKDGLTKWIHGWKRNGWKTAAKKPVKNEDLWRALDDMAAAHDVTWKWVKGHAGDPGNERADELAVLGAGIVAGKFPPQPAPDSDPHVWKLIPEADWQAAKARKAPNVPPAEVDRKDGFIHLSTGDEVEKTARLYFDDTDGLIALRISTKALGDALVYEWSGKRKAWFPHFYGDLPAEAVVDALPMDRNARKKWVFEA